MARDGGGAQPGGDGAGWAASRGAGRALRLMPVGDSATLGSGRDFTWRYRLWRHLADGDRPVEFVGPAEAMWDARADAPTSLAYADPDFDRRHCAMWGASLHSMAETIGAIAAAHRPDILLVHLGINDLAWYCGAEDALGHLRSFIAAVRGGAPEAAMIFEPILATQRMAIDPAFAAEVRTFTARAPRVVADLDRAESPLRMAEVAGGYDGQGDTYDGSHPNARGELKIAASFADALHRWFGVGAPFGAIPESVPNDVPAPGAPSAVTGTTHARLTWPEVPGAEAYNIYRRHLGPADGGGTAAAVFERLAWPVPQASFGDDYLFNGHVYEFRVTALRGNHEGPPSAAVRVTPRGPRPAAPAGFAVTLLPDGAAVLAWEPVEGVVGYYVHHRTADGRAGYGPWRRREPTIPETSLRLEADARRRPCEYRISAFGYAGESDPTAPVAVPRAPGAAETPATGGGYAAAGIPHAEPPPDDRLDAARP